MVNEFRQSGSTSPQRQQLGPMFIKPLDFIRHPGRRQPAYTRIPGLGATPLVVAAVCAAITSSAYRWVYWRELSKPVPAESAADLMLKMIKTENWLSYGALGLPPRWYTE